MKSTYREVQQFRQNWIWLLLALVSGLSWYGFVQQIVFGSPFGSKPAPDIVMWFILIAFGIGLPTFFYYLKLIVEVRENGILIRFFPLHSRFIRFDDLGNYEVRKYHPIREYGGWGIRWGSKGWAYNVSGNEGVQLELANGKRIMIGSQNPDKLAEMIRKAMEKS
jgi:hypothetical protein